MSILRHIALCMAGALSLTLVAPGAFADDALKVRVDQATLMRLPDKVGAIVIGNPLIADVTLQPGGLVVVTGKGYGSTNLVALDRDGHVLLERTITVSSTADKVLVVYRGNERQTYSCEPRCERRITLGDGAESFTATLNQTTVRNTQAASGLSNSVAP
jgi:hypothetical protein